VSHAPAGYRAAWEAKPLLRLIYQDYYRRIVAACRPGRTLEIGGGSGNLKAWLPDVTATDIVAAPWLDAVADAQTLPFADSSFDNIVMVDVLHHLSYPKRFFAEAVRVLRPDGRIVMVEPGITPLSWLFYALFHEEAVRMSADPLQDAPLSDADNPWDANQAIPTLLFHRHGPRFMAMFPDLELISRNWLSLLAYPLSGGFKPWQLLPAALGAAVLKLEKWLLPVAGPVMAFRLMVVLRRK